MKAFGMYAYFDACIKYLFWASFDFFNAIKLGLLNICCNSVSVRDGNPADKGSNLLSAAGNN
jgi:hypothetical protein